MGDDTLKTIGLELIATRPPEYNHRPDSPGECAGASQSLGEEDPREYSYPPDKQERASSTVLEQAEALSVAWAM
jgi:type I restriction enzyme R subunit